MPNPQKKINFRKKYIEYYLQTNKPIAVVCLRFDISRSTFYRWYNRYKQQGPEGLKDIPQTPKSFGNQKITHADVKLILELRKRNKWGPQRIATYFLREYVRSISKSTVWRILREHNVKPIMRYRRKRVYTRYSKRLPGDRVQIDVTKVAPGKYQFTAIDDCTRLRVLRIYPRKTAQCAIHFLGEMLEDFGFPIRVIQTDWGAEFFNDAFQEELMEHYIKFRPIKPRSQHLNGKVERSHQSDKAEFYVSMDKNDPRFSEKVIEWQRFYNTKQPHSALGGKTPSERFLELEKKIPIQPEVTREYWAHYEEVLPRNTAYLYRRRRKSQT
jgi:transposase InsO family protein